MAEVISISESVPVAALIALMLLDDGLVLQYALRFHVAEGRIGGIINAADDVP
jgi:hypothetical protein